MTLNNIMKKLFTSLVLLMALVSPALAQHRGTTLPTYEQFKGQAAQPSVNPPSGYYKLYIDNTGTLSILDSAGVVTTAGGGGGTPGGADTQVQFNDGGSFGGDAEFVFNKTTNALTLGISGGDKGSLEIYGTTGPNLIELIDGRIENSRPTSYFNFTNATGSLDFLNGKVVMNGTTNITSLTGGIGTSDAVTNTTTDALILRHESSGSVANNFGTRLAFQAESTTTSNRDMGGLKFTWATATDATRQSSYAIQALSTTQTIVNKEGFDYTNGRFFWNVDNDNPRWYMSIYDFYGSLGTGSAQVSSYLPAFPAPNEGGFTWVGDTDTGMYRAAANEVAFATSGTYRMSIDSSGDIRHVGNIIPTNSTHKLGDTFGNTYAALYMTPGAVLDIPGYIQGTSSCALTDNTIKTFATVSAPTSDSVVAGKVYYTIEAVDATNHKLQSITGVAPFTISNRNGTVTAAFGTVSTTSSDTSDSATFTNTFATSISGTDANLRITSDYDQATLSGTVTSKIRSRIEIDAGTATVAMQP